MTNTIKRGGIGLRLFQYWKTETSNQKKRYKKATVFKAINPHNADYVCLLKYGEELDMEEAELRKHRCCFTGHRPDKMTLGEKEIKPLLEKAIDKAIDEGFVTFVTGMAMGTDVWAAEVVLEKKKQNNEIHLVCALPHPGFEKRRSETEKNRFIEITEKADCIKLVNDHYFTGCYQVRNEWMVDRSARVIAVYDGQSGGTRNTIRYCEKVNVEVVNVLDREE